MNRTFRDIAAERPLFDELDLGAPASSVVGKPTPGAGLVKIHGPKDALSKDQQAFNRLASRIRNLKARLEQAERDHLDLDQFHLTQHRPALEALGRTFLDLALKLEETAAKGRPDKTMIRRLKQAIPSLLDHAFDLIEPTPEGRALHDKYTRKSHAAKLREEATAEADLFLDMAEMMGFEIPPEVRANRHDPEAMDAFAESLARQAAEDLEAEEQAWVQRTSRRKKTKKQVEKEAAEKAKAELKQRSLRDIYVALAKALHPDIEPDPEKRRHKEDYLKQASAAYQDGNLMELLQLEMAWLETSGAQDAPPDKLKLFLEVMKEQAATLERACRQTELRLLEEYGALSGRAARRGMAEAKQEADLNRHHFTSLLRDLEADPLSLGVCLEALLRR
jgi:hypothetical protein